MSPVKSSGFLRHALRATLCGLWFIAIGCTGGPSAAEAPVTSPVNLEHILSLVDSLEVDGRNITFAHIYADYPSYEPVPATGEGISCVDDVGRLMEVLEVEITHFGREELVPLVAGMARFLLYMQLEDGRWHNFIFADGSINTTHRNSQAEVGWWAARGLRGLAAAYAVFASRDPAFADTLKQQFNRTALLLNGWLDRYPATAQTPLGPRAAWLPRNAPDQSAEFLLALTRMHSSSSLDYSQQIQQLADGILTYQHHSLENSTDGMFFCWENGWHNWGNLQALALLEAYKVQGDSAYLAAVQRWAGGFLTWSVQNEYFWDVTISPGDSVAIREYPQIAYGISSSYRGIHALVTHTLSAEYSALRDSLLGWFSGHNRAETAMYDHATGRCYDGINSSVQINHNSGAESTIEALLALQYAAIP